jgi:saccharopine dehydrogenase-like NADP-dependent oxidoreductase
LDVLETSELRKFVTDSDIVIAYIPPQFIVPIAKVCAEVGRSMITSQYTFPEIKAME